MQTITVKATSNASGRAQRIAKGAGRQRTVSVDFSKSTDWNEGNAAAELGKVLGWKPDHEYTYSDGKFINHSV